MSTADEDDSTASELQPEVHDVRSPRRSIDPDETAFEGWMVDANESNTVAYGHLGSLIDDEAGPKTTGVVAQFRTRILREWIDLVELLGASTVDLQFALGQNSRTDPILIGNPVGDVQNELDLVAAAAPITPNDNNNIGRVEFTTGRDLNQIKDEIATNHMVEVNIGSDSVLIELLNATGDGAFDVIDDLRISESTLADSQVEKATRLNFTSDNSTSNDGGVSSDSQDEAVIRIPGIESEDGVAADELLEQVVAGALDDHGIDYDGPVSASIRREYSTSETEGQTMSELDDGERILGNLITEAEDAGFLSEGEARALNEDLQDLVSRLHSGNSAEAHRL